MHRRSDPRGDDSGFTLIELMAVVVVVAILLAIALPAYHDQVVRGRRAAAKSEILDIANRQEQYLLASRTYTSSAADINYAMPSDVASFYNLSISTVSGSGVPFFQITFTPYGDQASDGALVMDSEGNRSPADKWER